MLGKFLTAILRQVSGPLIIPKQHKESKYGTGSSPRCLHLFKFRAESYFWLILSQEIASLHSFSRRGNCSMQGHLAYQAVYVEFFIIIIQGVNHK